jgi:hypothetical protein
MKNYIRILAAVLAVALLASACGIKIKPSFTQIKTGPAQTDTIHIPMPAEALTDVELNLEFMAGELKLSPGATGSLVSGTATFNAEDLRPNVEVNNGSITLREGNFKFDRIPVFQDEVSNQWDLQLSSTPMNLTIQAGAYTGRIELGGLSLKKLVISEGGSDFSGSFSKSNLVEMSSFTYSTGGSTMVLKGLANANFSQMNFSCGAGDYTLSFDGDLKRDANVTIESGVSTVTILVPKGVNAVVTFEGGLTGINNDGWSQKENVYKLSGNGPTLTVLVKMGMGTLNLKTE